MLFSLLNSSCLFLLKLPCVAAFIKLILFCKVFALFCPSYSTLLPSLIIILHCLLVHFTCYLLQNVTTNFHQHCFVSFFKKIYVQHGTVPYVLLFLTESLKWWGWCLRVVVSPRLNLILHYNVCACVCDCVCTYSLGCLLSGNPLIFPSHLPLITGPPLHWSASASGSLPLPISLNVSSGSFIILLIVVKNC